jgi:hypothetical protein
VKSAGDNCSSGRDKGLESKVRLREQRSRKSEEDVDVKSAGENCSSGPEVK